MSAMTFCYNNNIRLSLHMKKKIVLQNVKSVIVSINSDQMYMGIMGSSYKVSA